MKKTVVKVNIYCKICKKDVLKAVAKLSGIDEVSVDGDKGLLTVTGKVDPVKVVKKVRKIGKVADVVSVGPPKAENVVSVGPPKADKKTTPEKPSSSPGPPKADKKQSPEKPSCSLPPYCNDCQLVGIGSFVPYPYDGRICTIL